MKNQAYRMTMLYDFYGEVLTDRQKEFYDLYYNEDLSLGEIAENYNITRQGVRDVIVRAAGILEGLEEKTGLIRRYQENRAVMNEMQKEIDTLLDLAQRHYEDPELENLVMRLQDGLDRLQREDSYGV